MTTIISSRIVFKDRQIDGRYSVREEHIDDQGQVYDFDYMADPGMDTDARLTTRAVELNAYLATLPPVNGGG